MEKKHLYFNQNYLDILTILSSLFLCRKLNLAYIFTLLTVYAYGQTNFDKIEFYFKTDTIVSNQGNTFTNLLIVKNNTAQELSIKDIVPKETYPGLLIAPRNPSSIPAGGEQNLFVKFIASTDFMKMESDAISFVLIYNDENGKEQTKSTKFFRKRNQSEEVLIYPLTRENFIDPAVSESSLSIFVENTGYASRSIQIEFEPNYAGIKINPHQLTVNLEGKEKKMLELKVFIHQQNRSFPSYNIQVKGVDLISNKPVSVSNIKINVLSSITHVMQNTSFTANKNYVEMSYNQTKNSFDYMQLKTNSKVMLSKDTYATFNSIFDYYLNQDAINLYDTYLEVERKGSLVRLGNIYANEYDFSVSGRGVKAIGYLGNHNKLEIVAVDNNYNLYSNYMTQLKGAKTLATKYSFGEFGRFNGKISYLYDDDPLQSINTNITHYSSSFSLDEKHNFRVDAGVSHEKSKLNKEGNFGASTGVNYEFRSNKWELSSNNTFATKSYAGMDRGSIYLHQNIGYRLNPKQRLILQYQNSKSQPKYIPQTRNNMGEYSIFNSFYSTHAIKTGIQFSNRKWNILLSPQIEKQKNTNAFIDESLLAYRFGTAISTFLNEHNLNVSIEYSYMEALKSAQDFSSVKAMISYRYKKFSLNGTAQYNPYNINDLNYFSHENKDFINYYLYSSYNFTALQQTLTGYISAGVNYSNLYKNMNNNMIAQVEYKISSSWASTASFNYSKYESLNSDGYRGYNYQLQVGLKKYLNYLNTNPTHRVDLQFYHDQNLNGVIDKDETLLVDQIIKLGDYVAMTDKNGKVSFRNVPKGNYKIYVSGKTGLRLLSDANILVNRNINAPIALGKSNKVKGKLVEIKHAYDFQEADVRGIVIYAEDEHGNRTYTAVDPQNKFEFFLKNGTYRIYIENQKYEYLEPSKTIELNNADHSEILIFEYRKKDRQIKVKKF